MLLVAALLVEDLRPHGHAGHRAGAGIGRASEHAAAEVGDDLVRARAPHQILAATRPQEVHAVALAVFLVAHGLAQLASRLELIKRRVSARAVAESGMARGVLDALVGDVDRAAVADALQVFAARLQHRLP